ncbi:MAG TPA: aldo/keto reductase [Phycisphaerae bacterium]|nr:aldo/keto reductase [Phycisphaerae bacterium]
MHQPVSRRDFLRTTAAVAAAATAAPAIALGEDQKLTVNPIPRRKLGRTGVEIPILNVGAIEGHDTRMLNLAYENGLHYFDSAKVYANGNHEKTIAEWFQKTGLRKDIFLVTKDLPTTPDQWVTMLDERLEALQIDQIDMYFLHALGDVGASVGEAYSAEEKGGEAWPASAEWGKAADKMKKSGKIKFVGFSTHCANIERRTALLNNAANGGWVDAIMTAADPILIRDNAEFSKAMDNCYNKGVGLVSMKETRKGLPYVKKLVPEYKEKGLNPYTAVLHSMWSDERIASICSYMGNVKQLTQNADAARKFAPLSGKEQAAVYRMLEELQHTCCHACDGSCQRAAGSRTAFADIARYLSYYEEDGRRAEARALFAALPPEQRDWAKANLHAASRACVSQLDFQDILTRAAQKLA